MILIDTSAFIEFLNRTGSREDLSIEQLLMDDEDVAIPDIALTEILLGIWDEQEYADVKKSLLTFPILSLAGTNSYITAAEVYRKCRKKGATVRTPLIFWWPKLRLSTRPHFCIIIETLPPLRGSAISRYITGRRKATGTWERWFSECLHLDNAESFR